MFSRMIYGNVFKLNCMVTSFCFLNKCENLNIRNTEYESIFSCFLCTEMSHSNKIEIGNEVKNSVLTHHWNLFTWDLAQLCCDTLPTRLSLSTIYNNIRYTYSLVEIAIRISRK